MDGIHDMGGMQGFGPVVTPSGDVAFHAAWERRQCAVSLLTKLDRSMIESMPADRYLEAGYYERWLWATERLLVEDGSITSGEVDAWQARLANGEPMPVRADPDAARAALDSVRTTWTFLPTEQALFKEGDAVRVRRMRPSGHNRCPRYVRGTSGIVRSVLGLDALPETADPSSAEPVYSVAFTSTDLWGATSEPPWTVIVDLWESYLEPMEAADG